MTQTVEQRSEFITRHLTNALFEKLSHGKWHHVPVGESPKFRIYGAGTAPAVPSKATLYTYAWLATVSLSVPRLMVPMHAIFLDEAVYHEVLGMFTEQTRRDWFELLGSGTRRLYYRQDDGLRRNSAVKPLMCSVADALINRLREMKLVIPIDRLDSAEMLESHEQQLVLASLGGQ